MFTPSQYQTGTSISTLAQKMQKYGRQSHVSSCEANMHSNALLHLAAHLYYNNGMNQTRLGKYLNVSQAKVSRLLAMAQSRGLVRVVVADFNPRNRNLEEMLRAQLGLSTAVVINVPHELPPEEARKILGMFAAWEIEGMIIPDDIIAIGSGRNVRELARNFPMTADKHVTIVQTVGNVDANAHDFDAQEIGRVLLQKLGRDFLSFNMPAFGLTKEMSDAFHALDQTRVISTCLDKARIAFVDIGTPEDSIFIKHGMFNGKDIAELKSAGAVGEIGGRFYDREGRECDTRWRNQVLSIELDRLAAIPQVIGVVSGADRSAAIQAAIDGGFLNGLIIDDLGARALLEY